MYVRLYREGMESYNSPVRLIFNFYLQVSIHCQLSDVVFLYVLKTLNPKLYPIESQTAYIDIVK